MLCGTQCCTTLWKGFFPPSIGSESEEKKFGFGFVLGSKSFTFAFLPQVKPEYSGMFLPPRVPVPSNQKPQASKMWCHYGDCCMLGMGSIYPEYLAVKFPAMLYYPTGMLPACAIGGATRCGKGRRTSSHAGESGAASRELNGHCPSLDVLYVFRSWLHVRHVCFPKSCDLSGKIETFFKFWIPWSINFDSPLPQGLFTIEWCTKTTCHQDHILSLRTSLEQLFQHENFVKCPPFCNKAVMILLRSFNGRGIVLSVFVFNKLAHMIPSILHKPSLGCLRSLTVSPRCCQMSGGWVVDDIILPFPSWS